MSRNLMSGTNLNNSDLLMNSAWLPLTCFAQENEIYRQLKVGQKMLEVNTSCSVNIDVGQRDLWA